MSHLPTFGGTFRLPTALSLLMLHLCLPTTATADWLVGLDGERVETRGTWHVKRSTVVFTSADGTLSSLRLADVDLEASARATTEAKSLPDALVAKRAEPPRRDPVLVLTTEDVGRAAEPVDDEAVEKTAEQDLQEEIESVPVEVISWRQVESAGATGLEIHGTLRNDSASIVTGAGVHVSLVDQGGELIGRREAFLDAVSVAARSTIGFRALFPGVHQFDGEPVFEVRGRELRLEAVAEDR